MWLPQQNEAYALNSNSQETPLCFWVEFNSMLVLLRRRKSLRWWKYFKLGS